MEWGSTEETARRQHLLSANVQGMRDPRILFQRSCVSSRIVAMVAYLPPRVLSYRRGVLAHADIPGNDTIFQNDR